jgi:hypothetical protein
MKYLYEIQSDSDLEKMEGSFKTFPHYGQRQNFKFKYEIPISRVTL